MAGNLLVIPVLNEAENIGRLLDGILGLGRGDLDVLVVDDHSTDETRRLVLERSLRAPAVRLIDNPSPEHGLAHCYKAGFRYALERSYEWVLGMDADLSHDPADLVRLLDARETADWIVGSRYIRGGRAKGLGFFRLVLSLLANGYLRLRFRLPVRDLTSGLNCVRAGILRWLDADSLRTKGFAFQVEIKAMALRRGCRLREIPIRFHKRRAGRSKFSFAIIAESVRRLWNLDENLR